MIRKLLLFVMALAFALPIWASEYTVTINRNEGLYDTGSGVYYCVKDGIMMTFSGGLDNENYLVESQQKHFEINSYNYIIKRIVFHCVDSTTSDNLDSFYWGPKTISIVQNFYNQSDPGSLSTTDYTCTWTGESNHMQFTTMARPVRFGSVEIVYDKLDGDIFDLVTNINQIQEGKTYIAVSQQYNKVMKVKKNDDVTIPATDIVEWMGPEGQEKTRVKVDGNALLFKMENVRDSLDGTRKGAILNTLNGYIRENMGGSGKNLMLSTGLTAYNSSVMYLGTAYNWLCWFRSGSSNSSNPIRYDNSADGFKIMSYNDANTRVFLYKLAEAYNITTVCDPSSGGSIELGAGVVNNTSQSGETVTFTVTPNSGYSLTGVDVTIDGTTTTVPVTDNGDGTYSFVMPAQHVTVTAHFDIAGAYQIFTENTPVGGGVVNVGGQVTTVDDNNYANGGADVTVTPSPNWGWESTGVTVTDASDNEVTVTDNGDGTYSFTMPETDATVHAGYKRVVGDIFDLVTHGSQIQEGHTYIIVSQTYDKVMRYWTPGQTTFASADIVDWPLGNDNKSKVRIDDNAVFFRMDNLNADTTSTGGLNLTRAAYLNTLNGYMRTQNYNVFLSSPLAQANRGSMMVSSNAYNYLLRFLYDNTSGSNTNFVVRYNDANGNFNVLNWTNDVNTRVWLYKLADSYNISTECSPPEGGYITLTGGMDENNNAQGGETITFYVGTNWGWTISEVIVTNTDTGESFTIDPVAMTDAGNSYSFVMPDGNVKIEAFFYESMPSLYLLGTAMGRTSWVAAGPRFNFDTNNQVYYLDVYFKGGNDNLNEDQAYGYFSLAQHIDAGTTWQTGVGSNEWNEVWGRLAAEGNNYPVANGSTNVVLYGDRPNNAFKIPAGVYRITVTADMSRMSITEIPLHLTLTPNLENGSTPDNPVYVTYDQLVEASSDLQEEVHHIANMYGISEDNQAFNIKQDDAAQWTAGNTTNITKEGTTKVTSEAYIGYITVNNSAYYAYTPLSYIERDEENKTTVVVCDDLVGTWAVVNDGVKYLWAKDDNRSNFRKEAVPAGQIDYVTDIGLQTRPWDQSNWVILDFSNVDDDPGDYLNRKIDALTIKGSYADKENHRIVLTDSPNENTEVVGYPGYNGDHNEESTDPDCIYYYNQYMSFNFLEKNLVAEGVAPGTDIVPAVDTSKRFYFMNPKIQEVAHIMGVWIGGNYFSSFTPVGSSVNGYDLDGIFKVNWLYNRTQHDMYAEPQGLISGTLYSFHGAVYVDSNNNAMSFNAGKPNSGENTPDGYTVYPFDLPSDPAPPTAIVEVPADKSIESIRYYNIMGAESTVPFQGVNIVVIRFDDGSSSSIKVMK